MVTSAKRRIWVRNNVVLYRTRKRVNLAHLTDGQSSAYLASSLPSAPTLPAAISRCFSASLRNAST